jgi:acyl-CoA reductase-like NAD-dependent aldehyde dehydrogenase
MLPLALYISDEFRLLSRAQLQRGIGQYFTVPDQLLVSAWQELKNLTPEVWQPGRSQALDERALCLPPLQPPPLDVEASNQRFNQYLNRPEQDKGPLIVNPGDLHPRFEPLQRSRISEGISKRLHVIALAARELGHELLLRPPSEDTLELTLEIFAQTLALPGLEGWHQFGICLGTSSKRALPVLGLLEHLGREFETRIPVLLLTGAPEPGEISLAQHLGYPQYPVMTDPAHCQIAFELCDSFLQSSNNTCLRARIGRHRPFAEGYTAPVPPTDIYLPARLNAVGVLRGQLLSEQQLQEAQERVRNEHLIACPLIGGESCADTLARERFNPAQVEETIGELCDCTEAQVREAFQLAVDAQPAWNAVHVSYRADLILRWGQRLQQELHTLAALCVRESGLALSDALGDLRTAINLCYYYSAQARTQLQTRPLHGLPGEMNQLELHGRGVYICITDNNDPLATLVGQLAAILVSGNAVLVNTCTANVFSATRLIELLLETGLPEALVALLPGPTERVSAWMAEDYRLAGAVFFGDASEATALNALISNRSGAPLVPPLTHSSLPGTQLVDRPLDSREVRELLHSAFSFAGQRRASLSILYIEESIAEQLETQLISSLPLWHLGNPAQMDIDIGPLVSRQQMDRNYHHIERLRMRDRLLAQLPLDSQHDSGFYVPPTLLRLYSLDELQDSVNGPLLHLIRFDRENLQRVIDEINRYCQGQAFGIHTEDESLIAQVRQQLQAGSLMINRSLVDPSAGVRPAGGAGISGTGPLYGGPNYLTSFVRERTVSRQL